jgi:hypothetical protein
MQPVTQLSFSLFHILLLLIGVVGVVSFILFIQHSQLREAEEQIRRGAARRMWIAVILLILLVFPGTLILGVIQLLLARAGIFFAQ